MNFLERLVGHKPPVDKPELESKKPVGEYTPEKACTLANEAMAEGESPVVTWHSDGSCSLGFNGRGLKIG